MNEGTCRFFSKFPHQITCKDYKVAVKKLRICKGPHLNKKENF